ncbi:putative disease resistance protein RGA1 [Phragmites australis]|uniref:putative disease resistance protein RGA1 n=1 Tax=Phragmites australis TaxID=29695 RepID=UPI002D77DEC3|nr:putative disease resistance protein RGA1 [Phragmites australis]
MADVVGLLASAIVTQVGAELGSAIGDQVTILCNVKDDMEDMKETLLSMAAVLKDAERRSVREQAVRLWLKRLKDAAYNISDMLDQFEEDSKQADGKMLGMLSCLPITCKKIVLANRMKKMRGDLRRIDEQQRSFNFTRSTSASIDQQHHDQRRRTSSEVNDADIVGRDGEKQAIIGMLSASENKQETMIVPIYGLGGMGKSTLAGLVYNDNQFIKKYDHRVWVYVSQVFDLEKIGWSIISQLQKTGNQQNTDMELINQSLDDLLPNKKILIVLDDIWEENDFELEKLKRMLRVGKKGIMIDVIVTTRKEDIAKKICTKEQYKLEPLQDDMCWCIIKRFSQLQRKTNKEQHERIGQEIAKKCGGVALAAQALGYMLESKDLHGWSEVNNSDIWKESSEDEYSPHSTVLPSLKLSFESMPPRLRLCFSYCAIFPKGYDIIEDDLIYQWTALDFIEPSRGKEYMKQLFGMSFLQHSKLPSTSGKQVVRYTMHDLVHDLARSVIGDELIVSDAATKSSSIEQKYCRYALLTNYDKRTKLSNILPKKVRALHFLNSSKLGLPAGAFSFAKCLRILDFSECSSIMLPAFIGQLKQLKCLIAPRMQNERLPECITELSKLQYLNLHGSSQISELPESIGKLGCLVYLGLSGFSGISKLTESFGDLKSMVHLDMSDCSWIRELPDSLGNLTNLQHIELSQCYDVKVIPESFSGLTQLQYLNLSSCRYLRQLPEAIGSLVNLNYLNMSYCRQIRELPESFKNLRNLLHLNLTNCRIVKGLPRALRGLTLLEHLDMSNIRWAVVNKDDLSNAMRNLTNLKYLNLSHSLSGLLVIEIYGTIVDLFDTLTNLEHLDLSLNRTLLYLPESIGNLKKLRTLDLSGCSALKSLPESVGAIGLKSLLMEGCSDELIDQANSRLHYSLILPLFKVRADHVSACSNLNMLEGVNVGELRIRGLENVRFLEEARKIKLLDKSNLSELTLAWTVHADRLLDDNDLLGQLVPPSGLKYMTLEGYIRTSFPSWFMGISHHLPNLHFISLDNLPACRNLPPLGQLPNLARLFLHMLPGITKIDRDFCRGKGAFRRLTDVMISMMEGLEEWNTTYSGEDGVEELMFPMLDELEVLDCPRLRLKPCPPTFRECLIWTSNRVISSLEERACGTL